MAALTALAIGAMAASAVGTGVAIYGQRQQAKTAKAVGEYNARVDEQNATAAAQAADYNAKLGENEAIQTELDNSESVRRKRLESARYASTQRARFAASGVTDEGSPLLVMAETNKLLEMDAQEMNRQASIKAAQLRAQAKETRRTGLFQSSQYTSQAGFSRAYGAASASAANTQAAATLIQGIGNTAGMAAGFKSKGII
jgi:hypothetical protein